MARSVTYSQAKGTLLLKDVRVPFEPACFDGSDKPRKSIVFEIDEEATQVVNEWESKIDSDRLCSALSANGVRAKVDIESVRVWAGKTRAILPGHIKGCTVNACISLSGIWNTKKQSGLSLTVTDLEALDEEAQTPFV